LCTRFKKPASVEPTIEPSGLKRIIGTCLSPDYLLYKLTIAVLVEQVIVYTPLLPAPEGCRICHLD
jgi:hypothetical protein